MKIIILKRSITTIFYAIALLFVNCNNDNLPVSPDITVTKNSLTFADTYVLGNSISQNIQVKASNLTSDLLITVSDNFEISLDNSNFSNQLSITKDDANEEKFTLYARFSPNETALGDNSGSISLKSSKIITVNLAGVSLAPLPVINVDNTSLDFDDTIVSEMSNSLSIIVNGDSLVSDINLVVSEGFEISTDNAIFTNTLQILATSTNDDSTIYVRFIPDIASNISGKLLLQNTEAKNVEVSLSGTGLSLIQNYLTFNNQHLFFGGNNPWGNQSSVQTFTLHTTTTKTEAIKMYVTLRCLTANCDPWDQFANIEVRDKGTDEWYEIGRYITPYGVDNSQLDRGFEIDVTDFKSLLTGSTELRAYIGVWGPNGWDLTVDFDYITGTPPDYPYYAISKVIQYAPESVPYGVDLDTSVYDLTKSVTIPANAESTHLRTIITGWGHATPRDSNGRRCAEWCYRTHNIKINGNITFQHNMAPIGCSLNPVRPQRGNWRPDRAGWCPGMAVPVRIDNFSNPMTGSTFTFEYDYEDWTTDGQNGDASYATSVFVVVKSNSVITKPKVIE